MADYIYIKLPMIPPPARVVEKTLPLYLELEISQEPMPEFSKGPVEKPGFEVDYTVRSIEMDI